MKLTFNCPINKPIEYVISLAQILNCILLGEKIIVHNKLRVQKLHNRYFGNTGNFGDKSFVVLSLEIA